MTRMDASPTIKVNVIRARWATSRYYLIEKVKQNSFL